MEITSPYGYGSIVPLEKHYKVLLPNLPAAGGGAVPSFAGKMNAMTISSAEFAVAGRDYPVVFIRLESGAYAPLVVLGLSDGRNLYVVDGHWIADSYVPAFARRYPFCLSQVLLDGVAQADKLVCIDQAYVDAAGVALFAADGTPTARWSERQRLLAEYEGDIEATAQMCAGLDKLGLFEPFTFQVTNGLRTQFKMDGIFRIDEARFIALKAASHKALTEKGWAARIYAHLFSLANFARLHQRAQDVAAAEAAAKKRAARK
ncbi:MAG: hypothetical protein JWN73_4642 [Betaproteobacteria bacterium]|nr:hypothetical protein [Betaproteobacteria bacterium]